MITTKTFLKLSYMDNKFPSIFSIRILIIEIKYLLLKIKNLNITIKEKVIRLILEEE